MIDAQLARRRRAVAAMGLGPLWVPRAMETSAASEAVDLDVRAASIATMDRESLVAAVNACRACGLGATRVRAVPGEGAERAAFLLVGTAPDADDETSAAAFAGPPGRLLDAMMTAIAVDRRADAFTTHLVKCRPPGDRAPADEEIARCRPFLERQVALLGARAAIAFGDGVDAGVALAAPDIERFVVPDPASLIAAPERKAEAWATLCEVRRFEPGSPDLPMR